MDERERYYGWMDPKFWKWLKEKREKWHRSKPAISLKEHLGCGFEPHPTQIRGCGEVEGPAVAQGGGQAQPNPSRDG
jgi:hypothetical protein